MFGESLFSSFRFFSIPNISKAQFTAFLLSEMFAYGIPKTDMIASPMNLSKIPSYLYTREIIASK